MSPDGPHRIGTAQILEAMELQFDQSLTSNMVINTEEIQVLGDRAYAYGTFTLKRISKEKGTKTSCSGSFLDILEKQADCSWKIAIDCRNYSEAYE
jgi:ketosteroid isomerase-like protein